MIIYRARNKVNGKVYIGQTIRNTPIHRLRCHLLSRHYFGSALRKYGRGNFEISIIDRAKTQAELNRKEAYWIKHYGSMHPNGYNLTTGGEGYKRSAVTIHKLKKSMEKYWRDPEFCRKISQRLKGRKLPEEIKRKISKALMGNVPWCKGKKLGPSWNKGLTKTDPRVAKYSAAKLGKPRPDLAINARKWAASPNYVNPMQGKKRPDLARRNRTRKNRQAVSHALKGRKFSAEHIANICKAQQARWALAKAA